MCAGTWSRNTAATSLTVELKTEFVSALQPAFGKLSDLELSPNQIVSHNTDLEEAMNTALYADQVGRAARAQGSEHGASAPSHCRRKMPK